VLAGPAIDSCAAANGGRGVLRLYGNYGGDKMNTGRSPVSNALLRRSTQRAGGKSK
jgi:dihydroxyacetone kinase